MNNHITINNVNDVFTEWTDENYLINTSNILKTYLDKHYSTLGLHKLETMRNMSRDEVISLVHKNHSELRSLVHYILTIQNLIGEYSWNNNISYEDSDSVLDLVDYTRLKFCLIINGDPDTSPTEFGDSMMEMSEHLYEIKNVILSKYSPELNSDIHFYDHMWREWCQYVFDPSVVKSLVKTNTELSEDLLQVRRYLHRLMENEMSWDDVSGVRDIIEYYCKDVGYTVDNYESTYQQFNQ